MALNREDIVTLARRYISQEEIVEFPQKGDLFCFLQRPLSSLHEEGDDDNWQFSGYGISLGYEYDYETKPLGKWILFYYLALNNFPPAAQVLKLQPPHIAQGRFNTADRTGEIKVVGLPLNNLSDTNTLIEKFQENEGEGEIEQSPVDHAKKDNIIQFPGNNKRNKTT